MVRIIRPQPSAPGRLSEESFRPQNPTPGTKWTNPHTGDTEEWDGNQWNQLTSLSQIIPSFGDGTDGDVTITSGTTTLARDMFYSNLTIASGASLDMAGFRVFVAGTTDGSGTLIVNGNDGIDGADYGFQSNGRAASAHDSSAYLGSSPSGKAGGVQTDGGTDAEDGEDVSNALASSGAAGGDAGAQVGAGSPGAGGAAGTATAATAGVFGQGDVPQFMRWQTAGRSTPTAFAGSAGSGGGGAGAEATGGGNVVTVSGGGSGSPGGKAMIASAKIRGSWNIQSIGGDGGDGDDANSSSNKEDGAGGGGAGSGGIVVLVYSVDEGWTGSIDVSGGTGGLGGQGVNGGGNGEDGGDGKTGVSYIFKTS